MYTLEDVYKTFPSGCTEDYKILRAFGMGKQTSDKTIESLSKHILDLQKDKDNLTDRVRELEQEIEKMKCPQNCRYGSISVWCDNSISIDCEKEKFLNEENWCDFCKNCKKWEIKEK